jgi:hypothetical protein
MCARKIIPMGLKYRNLSIWNLTLIRNFMAKKKQPEMPKAEENPEIKSLDLEEPLKIQEEDPDIIPDDDPFENPPPNEIPPPGEGP